MRAKKNIRLYIWVSILIIVFVVSALLREVHDIFDWLWLIALLFIFLTEGAIEYRQKEKIKEAERKKQELDEEIKKLEEV
jgi:hypothetical protein